MKSKFLNLKEFVLVIVLSCLMIGIGYLIMLPFAANMQLLYFLEPGLIGLVNGIVYVLMIRKCPKIGTQFIIAAANIVQGMNPISVGLKKTHCV